LVKAYSEDWHEDNPDNHKYEDSFVICNDSALHDSLADYYHKSKGYDVIAITLNEKEATDSDSLASSS